MTTRNLNKTLAEQLRITDAEICERKDLLGLTRRDEQELLSFRPHALAFAKDAVDEFYETQTAIRQVRNIIGDTDTLERLRKAMQSYVFSLFSGEYGLGYVNSRLRIGVVHARIGVAPKLYVSSMYQLEQVVVRHLLHNTPLESAPTSLTKLFLFDLQFVFDTYIHGLMSEVETAKSELADYSHSLEEKIVERTAKIEHLALTDELTGLSNRRSFYTNANQQLAASKRRGSPLTLVFADLDGFKKINDEQGHLAGDRVLKDVTRTIRQTNRASDMAFRYGGDEFCILLSDTDANGAAEYCRRLEENIRRNLKGIVGISTGIACAGPHIFPDSDQLVAQADSAMYNAKHGADEPPLAASGNR